MNGFQRMFPAETFTIKTISVSSGVSPQPMSNDETIQGAQNRATNAAKILPDGDYWVGIEGGVESVHAELSAFAWVVVLSDHQTGKGKSGTFFLPNAIADLVRQGKELGEADDIIFKRSNSKQDNGAIGILTANVIDRRQLYEPAVIMALIPFLNPELYK